MHTLWFVTFGDVIEVDILNKYYIDLMSYISCEHLLYFLCRIKINWKYSNVELTYSVNL